VCERERERERERGTETETEYILKIQKHDDFRAQNEIAKKECQGG
jgi:hypothetical protein